MSVETVYLDIETSPNLAQVWDLWNQNVSLAQLRESGDVLCLSAIRSSSPRVTEFWSVWDDGMDAMVSQVWELLDGADEVVHYNGRRFDIPWLQRLFVERGLVPPSPYRQTDLYRVCKREFRWPSHKLEYVARQLLGRGKITHEGFSLWVKVMDGDPSARKRFEKYCKRDTRLLVPLHEKLRPWIQGSPNAGLYYDGGLRCVSCGSTRLRKEGVVRSTTRVYQRYACKDCGKWQRASRSHDGVPITETAVN